MHDTFHALLVCTGTVFLGEIGDKTQLLALLLACRYRRSLPLIAGILTATIANHLLAAAAGTWLHQLLDPQWLRWILGISFIATALWALRPDTLEADDAPPASAHGLFWIAATTFFLAEIGDKTQIATALLAARFDTIMPVVAGTTLGMLLADVPVVLFGERIATRLPVAWIRRVAAAVFAALGVAVLLGA